MPGINLLQLRCPIFDQLQIEEALLRADHRNWCILNAGATSAIVMGISAKPEQVVNIHHLKRYPVALIRRFSGGGTVFIDEYTCFVTWICNTADIDVAPYPEKLMQWTHAFYGNAFPQFPFGLRENDYVCGEKKFGGNAQYIRKNRWLHHSSFLWDYKDASMDYLLMPKRQPKYRQQRPHTDFLCRLRDYIPHQHAFFDSIIGALPDHFHVEHTWQHADIQPLLHQPHRQSTEYVAYD